MYSASTGPIPRIHVISTGGTIATQASDGEVRPKLSGDQLLHSIPQLASVAKLSVEDIGPYPSPAITFPLMAGLAERIRAAMEAGADGVLITHGTDTLEETAYFLDLVLQEERPVVLTGAMRTASDPGADGPANVLDSVRVAAAPNARGLGVLVVMQAEVHAAQEVTKFHATNPFAFRSLDSGPLGSVVEARVVITRRPRRPPAVSGSGATARVELITLTADCSTLFLEAALAARVDGIVVQALGGGHVPPQVLPAMQSALDRGIPIVLVPRSPAGLPLTGRYTFEGSETDLRRRGVIFAGLSGPKARIELALALAAGETHDQLRSRFEDRIFS